MPKLTKTRDRGSRDWYQLQRWRNRAKHQLQIEPLCAFCLKNGRTTPATIADHVEPHGGDWNAFCLGRLQSLCHPCHSSGKAFEERHGYQRGTGLDGFPLDKRHPFYSKTER